MDRAIANTALAQHCMSKNAATVEQEEANICQYTHQYCTL